MVDDEEGDDEDFFEGGLGSEECRKIFEKRRKKQIDFIVRLVFLKGIGEKVFEEFKHRIAEDLNKIAKDFFG